MSTTATGPRTVEGKERAARNATKHGMRSERPIIPGEDPAEWDAFRTQAVAELAPGSFLEREMAERVALQLWRLRRAARYEAEVAEDEFHTVRMESTLSFAYLEPQDVVAQALYKQCEEITEQMKTIAHLEGGREVLRHLPNLTNAAPLDMVKVVALMAMLDITDLNQQPNPLTAQGLRRALVEWSGMSLAAAQEWATGITAAKCQTMVERLAEMSKQKAALEEKMKFTLDAQQRARRLLTKAALERVIRYEAHVSRQLNQALALLRQFKDERLAQERETPAAPAPVTPPEPAARETAVRETPMPTRSAEETTGSFGNCAREPLPELQRQRDLGPIETLPGERGEFVRSVPVEALRESGVAARPERREGRDEAPCTTFPSFNACHPAS